MASAAGIQCRCGRFLANARALSDTRGEGYSWTRFLSDVRGDCSRCGTDAEAAREGWWWAWDAWTWQEEAGDG